MSISMSLFIYFAIADYLKMFILYRIYSKSQKYIQINIGKKNQTTTTTEIVTFCAHLMWWV